MRSGGNDGPASGRERTSEQLAPLPNNPYDDPRFDLSRRYPGGPKARERDYEIACEEYERIWHLHALAGRFGKHDQYYAHRTEVHRAVEDLAHEVGLDGRTISLWLVREHSFPWRDNCELEDLQRLLAFLAAPPNRLAARRIPKADPRHTPNG
ncbi:hypothetical protein [Nocardia sp. XZ_19_385]|uniref:hypothetical protein n=1 Tax=Nocardia sp. XZ_19_385 TaxID=2769488 RepID=UPI0018907DF8|nr:hypothetical protein [Nocardia sp. XZ_19_385]